MPADTRSPANTRRLKVAYPGGTYPVHIGPGLRHHIGTLLAEGHYARRAFLISDTNVAPLYAEDVAQSLQAAGFEVHPVTLPAGEQHKNLDTVRQVYDALLSARIERRSPILALGGGVVGDLAGFVAATVLRGVPFIQVPTTLLAMVDASVGGKTGVDTPHGKNLVGAFKFPEHVVADVETLNSLPPIEFACGMAEVIKHGFIGDPSILERVQRPAVATSADLTDLIARAVAVKIRVVEEDPFEQGRRAVLNLGHTFGHALEQVSRYRLRHGLAVALGLMAAAHLAVTLNMADPSLVTLTGHVLQRAGLPTCWQEVIPPLAMPEVHDVLAAMQVDKKRAQGKLRFVVPRAPGDVTVISDVPERAVQEAVAAILR